jgi:hypothetical protein
MENRRKWYGQVCLEVIPGCRHLVFREEVFDRFHSSTPETVTTDGIKVSIVAESAAKKKLE